LERLQLGQTVRLAELKAADRTEFARLAESHESRLRQFEAEHQRGWQ